MFKTVLVANRGVIAGRIIRTLNTMGLASVAIYHHEDRQASYLRQATHKVSLGSGRVSETYLQADRILEIARQYNVDAIHPGYGFLSENKSFALACETAGITFIGPTPEQISLFGLKHEARQLAEATNVPCIPGSALLESLDQALTWAKNLGYPVMLKSTAGGGGIGMQVCSSKDELVEAWASVRELSKSYFSNSEVFVEKYIARARHIEVQVFGDGLGGVVSLGERDCSAQRRNQKVIEETPAPNLPDGVRSELCRTAEALLGSVNYRSAGTVEYIYDADDQKFYFLEVNTRLQVEHGVTEEVWNIDLVACMIRLAAGEMEDLAGWRQRLEPKGHAIQVRTYAEDPNNDFMPSPGLISEVTFPPQSNIRLESWVEPGLTVPSLFDPMLAKIISYGNSRALALTKLQTYLESASVYGVETNLAYVASILGQPLFKNGELLTNTLANHEFLAPTIEVVKPGTQTTIQDLGRPGYWDVGVPPSGPMDAKSLAWANSLLGNPRDAAALEITLHGPTLRFNRDTHIVLAGAPVEASVGARPVLMNTPFSITRGQTLVLGEVHQGGARAYLGFAGGIACPTYLGSKSTFVLGQFGGHVGRELRTGDKLRLVDARNPIVTGEESRQGPQQACSDRTRQITNSNGEWTIRVIYGPHGAPEYFTPDYINTFFDTSWEIHYNSSRTGIRLIGPQPEWVRDSGGDAGLHPSNIHDTAYAFGTVDFTGDMPVILGPDGPSLGGFVCPATVITADLWKLGQLRAGHRIRFQSVSMEEATTLEAAGADDKSKHTRQTGPLTSPVVLETTLHSDKVQVRAAGDHFVLIEVGTAELDIARRLRIQQLMQWLDTNRVPGMRELTPGVRSLQVHYNSQAISLPHLVDHIHTGCQACSGQNNRIDSRIVHLPLSWDDAVCKQAATHYSQSVRSNAPWCPDNLEFIRRINGLDSVDDVKNIVFSASYLVLGLGDVYLGAPLATPLDPRHRLVTTKYNPARTWTAENSVGIGGAYLCIYGMEGPGGYQLCGRTLQMWSRYQRNSTFEKPWLLRFFDQIRFFPVTPEELEAIREQVLLGEYDLKVESTQFDLQDYETELRNNQASIQAFSQKRLLAFNQEMENWRANGQDVFQAQESEAAANIEECPEGSLCVDSLVSGSIWELSVDEGDHVEVGQTLCLIESMKMEVPVTAPVAGRISAIHVGKGHGVTSGQVLMWIDPHNAAVS